MNRINSLKSIRNRLASNQPSIGGWMQIPHIAIAEIFGNSRFDWVAIDMEHGSISSNQLPELFLALEKGNTLPLVRLIEGTNVECKKALEAGAGGVIIPMIKTADQLMTIINLCRWPPKGIRGVGFSRANLYGENFEEYKEESQNPLIIAMIEHVNAIENLEDILSVDGLDAILIGPYDLSASMRITGEFQNPIFISTMELILKKAKKKNISAGIHIIEPNRDELEFRINQGFNFLPYSIDSVMLRNLSNVSI